MTVLPFPSSTLTVEQALEEARREDLSPVVIIGLDPEERVTVVSSKMSNERMNWLLDRAKKRLHQE